MAWRVEWTPSVTDTPQHVCVCERERETERETERERESRILKKEANCTKPRPVLRVKSLSLSM